jgi:hypothetical protein
MRNKTENGYDGMTCVCVREREVVLEKEKRGRMLIWLIGLLVTDIATTPYQLQMMTTRTL